MYLNTERAAAILRIHRTSLWRWAKVGKIASSQRGFRVDDVLKLAIRKELHLNFMG